MSGAERQLRVMVVDDSAVVRGLWARIVDREDDMRVTAAAADGRAALETLRRKEVDVVVLDVEMPGMNGLEALPLILEEHPGVAVLMASALTRQGAQVTMRALSLGAADYVAKPSALNGAALDETAAELVRKIRALGRPSSGAGPGLRSEGSAVFHGPTPSVIGITSSTGGPNALTAILSRVPAALRQPIVVVQHMPPVFTAMLAEGLGRETGRTSVEAEDGGVLEEGHTYVAPGDRHLVLEKLDGVVRTRLLDSEPENFCRPSADPFFRSLATVYGSSALAVVLTGMGSDGVEGVRAVRAAGGRVVVQDEATSVVWGMPGAVVREGLAHDILPLGDIAAHLSGVPETCA